MEHMFSGQYQHAIDDKGRLTLPAKLRAALATGFVVTRGLDGCLFVFPQEEWSALSDKLTAMSVGDAKARQVARFFFSGACDCTPDKQGRVLLPAHLRDYANIEGEAIVTGMGNRLELWSTAAWAKTISDTEEDIAETSQALAELF